MEVYRLGIELGTLLKALHFDPFVMVKYRKQEYTFQSTRKPIIK